MVCAGSDSDLGQSINLSAKLLAIELSDLLREKRVTECATILVVTLFDRVCQVVDKELRGYTNGGALAQRDAVIFGSELLELLPQYKTGAVHSA